MRLQRRDVATLAVGLLLGWAASRAVIPVPELVLLSPQVSCGGYHEVAVPLAENVRWAVKAGTRWWDPVKRAWVMSAPWHVGPGKMIVGPAPGDLRLVVEGFRSGNVAGASIRKVEVQTVEKGEGS